MVKHGIHQIKHSITEARLIEQTRFLGWKIEAVEVSSPPALNFLMLYENWPDLI